MAKSYFIRRSGSGPKLPEGQRSSKTHGNGGGTLKVNKTAGVASSSFASHQNPKKYR